MEQNVTVIILAAGLGTRMKSKHAKVLHRAGGLTLVEHVVDCAVRIARPERIFVVVGHQADKVRASLAHRGVGFVEQTEQRGTGQAVAVCREDVERLGGLVVILNGDGPLLSPATLERLVRMQSDSGAAATAITTTLENPFGYGRIIRDPAGNIEAIVEQKAGSPAQLAIREINAGIYCFRSELLWKYIGQIEPNNAAREFYLTDIVEILRANGRRTQILHLDDSSEVLGINTRAELADADRILRERKVRQLMLDGVTIRKPETVTIDTQVCIGIDSVIEPFAQILGKTVIGEDCTVGACSIIEDSTIESGVRVDAFTIVGTSHIEAGAVIGPYARLRMGNHVAAGAHVGNFVELKKTQLGAGAKANHLAYLGDSVIGPKVNIGAGTITCNYDGVNKHQTKIGEGAFVGSNSTLVAPVEIGNGAYVGAGSVVTHAVPPDALAVGRGHQVIKEGWARQRRAKVKKL